jgi:hypothetical protein
MRNGTMPVLNVALTIENITDRELGFWCRNAYLLDEAGNRSEGGRDTVGITNYGGITLAQGVRIRTSFAFQVATDSTFSFGCVEAAPKEGRQIVIHGLAPR